MATLMKTILGGFAAAALLTGGAVVMNMAGANVAYAQSSAKATVDSAIARGEIGEQSSGYLAVVDGASPSSAVVNAMNEINIARKSVYTRAAANGPESATVYAQLTGEKQIKKAAPGTYVKDASGVWKKK